MERLRDLSKIDFYLNQFNLISYLNDYLINNCEIHTFKKGENICNLGEEVYYYFPWEKTKKQF